MPEPVTTEELLVGFATVLRAAGMAVTPDRTGAFVEAVSLAGLDDRAATYWSGRATFCSSLDDIEVFERAFTAWFEGSAGESRPPSSAFAPRQIQAALIDDAAADPFLEPSAGELLTARASPADVLRHRDIAHLTMRERAQLARLFESLDVAPALRRALRRRPHHRGRVDLRRTLRAQLRSGGEPARLRRRRRMTRARRIVVLIDVSGSMQAYADALVRLGHRLVRALPGQVEVFTVGTRLTRITPALVVRRPDEALEAAGRLVPDWSGGTRLGEVVRAFLTRWGRRGLARNAIVVIASDGWERGDAALLGEQMRQLQLLAHALIWMNPHRGKAGYAPIQTGIQACLPHLDRLVAGHSLAAFTELLGVLADV